MCLFVLPLYLPAVVLQGALQEQLEGQMERFHRAVQRRQRLLRAGGGPLGPPEGPQQQLAEAVRSVSPVSILCGGGGVVLPLLSLQVATHVFSSAAYMRDIRECGASLPIRLVAAESLSGPHSVTQKLLTLNAEVHVVLLQCASFALFIAHDLPDSVSCRLPCRAILSPSMHFRYSSIPSLRVSLPLFQCLMPNLLLPLSFGFTCCSRYSEPRSSSISHVGMPQGAGGLSRSSWESQQ